MIKPVNTSDANTLLVHQFDSGKAGPALLLLGAVHGNEDCGVNALTDLLERLSDRRLVLACGSLTVVPVCNPQAFVQGKRFIDCNLNRIIGLEQKVSPNGDEQSCGEAYEHKLAPQIAKLILEADYVVDLHSFTASGEPFVIAESDSLQQKKLLSCLPIGQVIFSLASSIAAGSSAGFSTTADFAARNGVAAVVVECGNHQLPQTQAMALKVVAAVIESLLCEQKQEFTIKQSYEIFRCYFRSDQSCFAREFKHLEFLPSGSTITVGGQGPLVVAEDCYLVLPNANAQQGAEWFYLAKRIH